VGLSFFTWLGALTGNGAVLLPWKTSLRWRAIRVSFKAADDECAQPMPYIYLESGNRANFNPQAGGKNPATGMTFLVSFYLMMISGLLSSWGCSVQLVSLGNQVSRILLGISVMALAGFGLFQLWRGVFA